MTLLPAGILKTPQGVYVLEKDSHLSRWCESHGRLDIACNEIAAYAQYIPAGGTVIDAGACLGDHAATYANLVGPTGTVLAFEPGWLTYQALWLNFENVPQVKCHHAALGSQVGRGHHEMAENAGSSHLTSEGQDNVEVVTIDSLGLSRLDFVHLDAEGFEFEILRGAEKTLRSLRPVMVLEINKGALGRFGHTDETIYCMLAILGYKWQELGVGDLRHYEQRDILCLPV